MPGQWEGSDRRAELPPNWQTEIVPAVWERAKGRCEAHYRDGRRCPDGGADVDHKQRGNDHRMENLQLLCDWHHDRKSSAEGNAARTRLRMARPAEQHPGLI